MAENQTKDQKTENATPQQLRKAREEGKLGFSTELVGGVVLLTAAVFFWFFGSWFVGVIAQSIQDRFTRFETVLLDPRMLVKTLVEETLRIAAAVAALAVPLVVLTGMCGLLQTGFNVSTKPLELKAEKLSVISGFKKIFSMQSAVRGVMSMAKAIIIVGICVFVARGKFDRISTAGFGSIQELLFFMGGLLVQCSLAVSATMVVLALFDLGFQKWKHLEDMKMSRQDIKDEHKSTEGDPMIRARIKQVQAELGRKRMMAAVKDASVVVKNPTHYAVALKYDRDEMEAPVVVAKGADHVALKILDVAKEHGVPIVEKKSVARFLYKNVEIGRNIPLELYQAVAEILNFVNQMRSAV